MILLIAQYKLRLSNWIFQWTSRFLHVAKLRITNEGESEDLSTACVPVHKGFFFSIKEWRFLTPLELGMCCECWIQLIEIIHDIEF